MEDLRLSGETPKRDTQTDELHHYEQVLMVCLLVGFTSGLLVIEVLEELSQHPALLVLNS